MNKRTLRRLISVLAVLALGLSLLTGCGTKSPEQVQEQEDAQTIQVYLWSNSLYESYAPYVQAQLPDVNIEFIVGNNDLDFYKFLQQNGGLPDIITCCRFSLHDAAPLKDSLMNLALTNEAGAVYNTYLNSFKNEDGSVNWLPVCADAHGFVVNRSLFEQYDIPLPTDYASFVAACQAFEAVGIRGFTADYAYDYNCMETLQGLSAAELTTTEGRKWRTAYSDPASTVRVGLDDAVWPGAFERMAQFIQDTHLTAEEINRILTDRISDILFCPTDKATENLVNEGYGNIRCQIVKNGDVMQDAALFYADKCRKPNSNLPDKFVLCTVHRAENTDNLGRLKNIFMALENISDKCKVVLPLHPRTKAKLIGIGYDFSCSNICFIQPVGYLEMVWLLKNCELVMTDSGGLQKEAYFFGKYCVTMRDETEWVELVDNGFNRLVGSNQAMIEDTYALLVDAPKTGFENRLYGNGDAGNKILESLQLL